MCAVVVIFRVFFVLSVLYLFECYTFNSERLVLGLGTTTSTFFKLLLTIIQARRDSTIPSGHSGNPKDK